MITPVAAKEARKTVAEQALKDLLLLVEKHSIDLEKEIDQNLVRAGLAHVSQHDVIISSVAKGIIEKYQYLVTGIKDIFTRKVLGTVETKYRGAGWHTIIKPRHEKSGYELIIKEKEVDEK